MFVITIFCLIMVAVDFLALHDIKNDYVSPGVLSSYELKLPEAADWTRASLEWTSVRVSWFLKLILLIVNIVVIFKLERNIRS